MNIDYKYYCNVCGRYYNYKSDADRCNSLELFDPKIEIDTILGFIYNGVHYRYLIVDSRVQVLALDDYQFHIVEYLGKSLDTGLLQLIRFNPVSKTPFITPNITFNPLPDKTYGFFNNSVTNTIFEN